MTASMPTTRPSSVCDARLGEAARERIRTRYDWEKVADAHDSFFPAVAARHGIPIAQRPFPSELGA